MPSFLSKVFGRKKHDDKDGNGEGPRSPTTQRTSQTSLLEGKFEAVSPTVSPSIANFTDASARGRDSEGGFSSLFRQRSPSTSPTSPSHKLKTASNLPHLSLNLPGPKDEANSRALGVVFEADPDGGMILSDSVIGARRLSPLETLILVRACAQAITNRGLETLGIMHPHWYSASPEIQRRLISLFVQSLAPKSPITTLSPTPSSPISAFESEINFARSPHDVAAVLRWGLRHLKLEGTSFGKDTNWYKTFVDAERSSSYSPKAFSNALVTQLPPAHVELLLATLEIISLLAAHAEHNGISGSKLAKFLGLWLLTSNRSEESDDWVSFYTRWERSGRILEHLFLSRIRDEAVSQRMPTRLLELVSHYPYSKGIASQENEDGLLHRPRFSTRQCPTLLVRVETELPSTSYPKPKSHTLRLIADAFKCDRVVENEHGPTWDKIKSAASNEGDSSPASCPVLSRVFADETIRLLSLIPADSALDIDAISPTLSLFPSTVPRTPTPVRRRSFSFSDATRPSQSNGASTSNTTATNGHARASTGAPGSSAVYTADWAQFSSTGFGETAQATQALAATLLDTDLEVTNPPAVSRKSSKKPKTAASRRSSTDNPTPASTTSEDLKLTSKTTEISLIQLDEAFIDFWSDALLDPISASFPTFVICKLKPQSFVQSPETVSSNETLTWLLIERKYTYPAPLEPTSAPAGVTEGDKARPSSPRPSTRSDIPTLRIGSTLAATRKRFSFFSSRTSSDGQAETSAKGRKRTSVKSPKIGEMGEILREADEKDRAANPVPTEDTTAKPEDLQEQGAEKADRAELNGDSPIAAVNAAAPEVKADSIARANAQGAQPVVLPPVLEQAETKAGLLSAGQAAEAEEKPIISESKSASAEDVPISTTAENKIATPQEESSTSEVKDLPAAPVRYQELESQLGSSQVAEIITTEALPPAPESVVLEGSTPGPQVALETSEPARLAAVGPKPEEDAEHNATIGPTLLPDVTPIPELEPIPIVETSSPAGARLVPTEDIESVKVVPQPESPVVPKAQLISTPSVSEPESTVDAAATAASERAKIVTEAEPKSVVQEEQTEPQAEVAETPKEDKIEQAAASNGSAREDDVALVEAPTATSADELKEVVHDTEVAHSEAVKAPAESAESPGPTTVAIPEAAVHHEVSPPADNQEVTHAIVEEPKEPTAETDVTNGTAHGVVEEHESPNDEEVVHADVEQLKESVSTNGIAHNGAESAEPIVSPSEDIAHEIVEDEADSNNHEVAQAIVEKSQEITTEAETTNGTATTSIETEPAPAEPVEPAGPTFGDAAPEVVEDHGDSNVDEAEIPSSETQQSAGPEEKSKVHATAEKSDVADLEVPIEEAASVSAPEVVSADAQPNAPAEGDEHN